MNEVLAELAKEHTNVKFFKVEAELLQEITVKYEVLAVPTILLFKVSHSTVHICQFCYGEQSMLNENSI
jgi:hypothetical protein